MVARRAALPCYLGASFAIGTTIAASLGYSVGAQAQDLNLQTQLNIVSPSPLGATSPSNEATSPTSNAALGALSAKSMSLRRALETKTCTTGSDQKDKQLIELLQKFPEKMTVEEYQLRSPKYLRFLSFSRTRVTPFAIPPGNINFTCTTVQPTTIKVSFPLNPTYETDVLKTGNNSSPGESFGIGGNVLVTTGGLRPFDLVVLNAQEASARYTPFSSPNVDVINSFLAYQYFLGAVADENGRMVPIDEHNPPPANIANMITVDTLAFGVQNQTAFTPTFHQEKADFFTPQFTLSRQNTDLDDPNDRPCLNSSGKPAFCYYANLSLTVGESFSDVTTQQNANVAAAATLGWRPNGFDWNLSLQAMATAKDYEDVVGGRQDLLLQIGPVFTYAPKSTNLTNNDATAFTFSLPVTYYKNYSTVSAAAWSGLIIMPTLTVAFSHTVPAVMPTK
jgi:hypothetical protein